jgi:hypothetical protein
MNATFDRFGSLNARPILHHAAAKRMETSPALGPRRFPGMNILPRPGRPLRPFLLCLRRLTPCFRLQPSRWADEETPTIGQTRF